MDPVRLVTLDPGHFHAALVQKEMHPAVDPRVHVYAPPGPDLDAHLKRINRFNTRPDRPTSWVTTVHAGPDWLDRFLAERPGNTVVLAGRNRPKIDLILRSLLTGYCVLADKPWIIKAEDFHKVVGAVSVAGRRGLIARDVMTERWEPTTRVQRGLIHDPEVFGSPLPGSPDAPALELESDHYLSKQVAGVPLRRPAWWFDPAVAGEALADVGTHLADLALWLLFPDAAVQCRADQEALDAEHWATRVGRDAFREITGLADFPPESARQRDGDHLTYWGNGTVLYRLRDRYVRFTTRWGVRPDGPGGDTHFAVARGSRAAVTVRHDAAFGPGPQVFVAPTSLSEKAGVLAAVERHCRTWSERCPGYAATDLGDRVHVRVPDADRTGHESHFASVLGEFVTAFRARSPGVEPEWLTLLAKYYLTTRAVKMARTKPPRPPVSRP